MKPITFSVKNSYASAYVSRLMSARWSFAVSFSHSFVNVTVETSEVNPLWQELYPEKSWLLIGDRA